MSRFEGVRAAALAAILACGPGAPDDTTSATDTTSTTGTTTGDATTTTGALTTSGTSTTGSTSTTDVEPSTGPGTTEAGVCVVDPATDTCTDACSLYIDCCKCVGQTRPIVDPQECTIAAGIVTAACFWGVLGLRLDGQGLEQRDSCADLDAQWTQTQQGGDIVLELCGDTCAAYLDGKFAELKIEMFCESP